MDENTKRIATLNDELRVHGVGGQMLVTGGIQAMGPDFLAAAVARLRAFQAFTAENDPYGEHDFGAFELMGTRVFWRLCCKDRLRTRNGLSLWPAQA